MIPIPINNFKDISVRVNMNIPAEAYTMDLKDADLAYMGERDKIQRVLYRKMIDPITKKQREHCRQWYNVPFINFMSMKRQSVLLQNITNSIPVPAEYNEEPVVKGEFCDVSGVNLITSIVQPRTSQDLKYACYDGGVVLSTYAAHKMGVSVGDKIMNFGCSKLIVSKITIARDLPDNCECLIGRTKINTRQAIFKELEASELITGKRTLFWFKVDYKAENQASQREVVLSQNYLEACASNEHLMKHSMFPREVEHINNLYNPAYLNIVNHKMEVRNGDGKALKLTRIKAHDTKNNKVDYYIDNPWASWIPVEERSKITNYQPTPSGKRYEYTVIVPDEKLPSGEIIRGSSKTHKSFEDAHNKRNPSIIDQLCLRSRYECGDERFINLLIHHSVLQFRPILIPASPSDCGLDTIILSDEMEYCVGKNPETTYTAGQVVITAREPIVSIESVLYLKVAFKKDMPWGVAMMRPELFAGPNFDTDGDCIKIIKPSSPIHAKKTLNKAPKDFSLIDGANAPSGYNDEHVENKFTAEEYQTAANANKVMQQHSVVRMGTYRKKILAAIQHMGPAVMEPMCKLLSVELGMQKISESDKPMENPRVLSTVIAVIWKLISHKKTHEFKNYTNSELLELNKFFNIRIEGRVDKKGVPYNINIIDVCYPRILKLPAGLDNITVSPVGQYHLDILRAKNTALNGLYATFNATDESPYAKVLKGF